MSIKESRAFFEGKLKKNMELKENHCTLAKPILLTDKGESLCRQIISKMERQDPLLDQIMFAGLSESDRQHLEKMLGQIYRNLESDAFRNLQNSNVPEPDSLRN